MATVGVELRPLGEPALVHVSCLLNSVTARAKKPLQVAVLLGDCLGEFRTQRGTCDLPLLDPAWLF